MACGLSRGEALDLPLGEVQDLAAIYQIRAEGCRYRAVLPKDEEILPDVN